MNFTDRIKPTDKGIGTYLDDLRNQKYQIPTFQRDVVWDKDNVKKLWDSIYKFYPLGSILVWKTELKLQNHREIGGHKVYDIDINQTEYQYLLDGQQRTTSLLTSIYGGRIDGRHDFDPTLYIDLTIADEEDTDDESYKNRFLYWEEIDDRSGTFRRNSGRTKRYNEGLIVKLSDIKQSFGEVQERIVNHAEVAQTYTHPYWEELRRIQQVLTNYRLSFIELKGIQVAEVCQIFERINQAGKPLDIFDIVVAKTFEPSSNRNKGFYLREVFDEFRKTNNSNFLDLSNFDFLQILAILIRENIDNSGVRNITNRYLNEIKTNQIKSIWPSAQRAILKTFDFFENNLNIKGPQLLPYRYFYMTIANYFYENNEPDYNFLKKYFWFHSFHRDDLLSNTTDIINHIAFLNKQRNEETYDFGRFLIDRNDLRKASYSSRGRYSRAILSLMVSKEPRDWKYTDRKVVVENVFISTDRPNLHHIFPTNYLNESHHQTVDGNSLMNIAYLTQLTNLKISDKNPVQYIKELSLSSDFSSVIQGHIIPSSLLEVSNMEQMPIDYLDQFIDARIELVIYELKTYLGEITFEDIDSKEHITQKMKID